MTKVVTWTRKACAQSDSPKIVRPIGTEMALKQQQVLLSRLQKLVREWPSDPSKKGRDFGEFLKQTYAQKFKEEAVTNVSRVRMRTRGKNMVGGAHSFSLLQPQKAAAALESLERLDSNYYRGLYAREKELTFTGELAAKNPWILSNGRTRTSIFYHWPLSQIDVYSNFLCRKFGQDAEVKNTLGETHWQKKEPLAIVTRSLQYNHASINDLFNTLST